MKKILVLSSMILNVIHVIARMPDDFYMPDPEDKPNYALNIIIIIVIAMILYFGGRKKDDN